MTKEFKTIMVVYAVMWVVGLALVNDLTTKADTLIEGLDRVEYKLYVVDNKLSGGK